MKKVRFSSIVTTHEVGNTEEHRSARDGDQERRDRERFRIKYMNFIPTLNKILEIRIKLLLFNHLCKETDVFLCNSHNKKNLL